MVFVCILYTAHTLTARVGGARVRELLDLLRVLLLEAYAQCLCILEKVMARVVVKEETFGLRELRPEDSNRTPAGAPCRRHML